MPTLRFRPSKEKSVLGIFTGAIMIGVGIFWAIPAFGSFGFFWTLIAVAITGYNAFLAFSNDGTDSEVRLDDFENFQDDSIFSPHSRPVQQDSIESRLKELEGLRVKDLISEEEYQEKRVAILREL
jgi:hypothetical protein